MRYNKKSTSFPYFIEYEKAYAFNKLLKKVLTVISQELHL